MALKKLTLWLPAIIVALVIFILSAVSGNTVTKMGLDQESIHINGHFILYFVLTFALYKATKNILLSVALSMLYGFLNEVNQLFVPQRSFQLIDIITNSLGIIAAGILLWKFYSKLPKKLKNWLEK